LAQNIGIARLFSGDRRLSRGEPGERMEKEDGLNRRDRNRQPLIVPSDVRKLVGEGHSDLRWIVILDVLRRDDDYRTHTARHERATNFR
jgi:hypothetical protein